MILDPWIKLIPIDNSGDRANIKRHLPRNLILETMSLVMYAKLGYCVVMTVTHATLGEFVVATVKYVMLV